MRFIKPVGIVVKINENHYVEPFCFAMYEYKAPSGSMMPLNKAVAFTAIIINNKYLYFMHY